MKVIKKLFIIDDDEINTFLTQKIIEQSGFVEDIKCFYNSYKALEFIEQNLSNHDLLPDIILLDMSMPILSGLDFIKEYERLFTKKNIYIYIYSAAFSNEDISFMKSKRVVSDCFVKPLTKERFISIVEKCL